MVSAVSCRVQGRCCSHEEKNNNKATDKGESILTEKSRGH